MKNFTNPGLIGLRGTRPWSSSIPSSVITFAPFLMVVMSPIPPHHHEVDGTSSNNMITIIFVIVVIPVVVITTHHQSSSSAAYIIIFIVITMAIAVIFVIVIVMSHHVALTFKVTLVVPDPAVLVAIGQQSLHPHRVLPPLFGVTDINGQVFEKLLESHLRRHTGGVCRTQERFSWQHGKRQRAQEVPACNTTDQRRHHNLVARPWERGWSSPLSGRSPRPHTNVHSRASKARQTSLNRLKERFP